MDPDDHVCLCYHVSKRKIVNFCRWQKPSVASVISECLSAGTGCGWCVPFLTALHRQTTEGVADPDLPFSPREYASRRLEFHKSGTRRGVDDQGNATPS